MICRECENDFKLYPGKPGLIDECPACARDVPRLTAEMGSDDTGVVETITTREDFYSASRQVFREVQKDVPKPEVSLHYDWKPRRKQRD